MVHACKWIRESINGATQSNSLNWVASPVHVHDEDDGTEHTMAFTYPPLSLPLPLPPPLCGYFRFYFLGTILAIILEVSCVRIFIINSLKLNVGCETN